MKRVIVYLRGSSEVDITFKGESIEKVKEMNTYVDTNYATDKRDRKLISGYLV